MDFYEELPTIAQASYAQLLESAQTRLMTQSVRNLNGSFARKTIKGSVYWYFQYRDVHGKVTQIYVGPDNERVRGLVEKSKLPVTKTLPLKALAESANALGCASILPKHFRIIRRLSEYGFFRAGGVLIGTHAFIAMGNMLGVRWVDSATTQDVDFAHAGKNFSIALPVDIQVDVQKAIDSLEMGFLPIQSFSDKPGTGFINEKDPELRVDFLTSLTRGGETPYQHKNLNVALQPLKFMEFSLEGTTQGVVFCNEGAVLVNLPSPIRYGLHKLLVYGERDGKYRTKAIKDIKQSVAILSYYARHMPEQLDEALTDLLSRGPGWRKRALQGMDAALQIAPDLAPFIQKKMPAKKPARPAPSPSQP